MPSNVANLISQFEKKFKKNEDVRLRHDKKSCNREFSKSMVNLNNVNDGIIIDNPINKRSTSEKLLSSNDEDDLVGISELSLSESNNSIEKATSDSPVAYFENVQEIFSVNSFNEDDFFGLNSFSQDHDNDNNLIIEAYNDRGRELVYVTLAISKKCIDDGNLEELVADCDLVFYENDITEEENVSYKTYIIGDDNISDTNIKIIDSSSEDNTNNFEETNETRTSKRMSNFEEDKKINHIIEELLETQQKYIDKLDMIVNRYMPYLYKQQSYVDPVKLEVIFGNIKEIFDGSETFTNQLKKYNNNADKIAKVFLKNYSHFDLYPLYSKNKPKADVYLKELRLVLKEAQDHFDDKLGLASHLLTPIQRLGKYILLLEEMKKRLSKINKNTENLEKAIDLIRKIMRKGNDFIAIDSIKEPCINLHMQGSFIMRASFSITKPRKFTSVVFLFENAVIFTEAINKNIEEFKYVDHIFMGDLRIAKFEKKPQTFNLESYTRAKRNEMNPVYTLLAESAKVKKEWTTILEKILWGQLNEAKQMQLLNTKDDNRDITDTSLKRKSSGWFSRN